jgi:cardiolipin synthase
VGDFIDLFECRWREAGATAAPADFDTGGRHAGVRLVSDGPLGEPIVLDSYVAAFRRARRRIWLENAYFFPHERILLALADAARRGVEVCVVLPGQSDVPIIARAARSEYLAWLCRGIRVFEYQPVVLHTKAALVDDDWCSVGTFNANPTSVRFSIELSLEITDRRFVATLARQIEHDMARSLAITRDDHQPRPALERAIDHLAYYVMNVADGLLLP